MAARCLPTRSRPFCTPRWRALDTQFTLGLAVPGGLEALKGLASPIRRPALWFTNFKHAIRWGGRLRASLNNDTSVSNFGGTYTFFGGNGPELDANNQPIPG